MTLIKKLFSTTNYLERGERIIKIHKGKYTTYRRYLTSNPSLAEQYLAFVGKNPGVVYIRFDKNKQRFTA
jgi:hypothetical protein